MKSISHHTGPFLTSFVLPGAAPPPEPAVAAPSPQESTGPLFYHPPREKRRRHWCSDAVTWCYDHWGALRIGVASFLITCLLVAGMGGFFAVDYISRRDGYDRYPALFSFQSQPREGTYRLTFWGTEYTFSTDPVKSALEQAAEYSYLLPAPIQLVQDLIATGIATFQQPWNQSQ